MRRTFRFVACAALWASNLSAQGDSLYSAWCARCHGADARGTPVASARLEVPPADLAACAVSSAEPEDQWVDIVAQGGAPFGLSLDMPAYGEAGTTEQIRMVVRYIRSLCRERGWPPGELNFPRAFRVEKAFPENEVIVAARGHAQHLIYERRIGRRFQIEATLDRPFDGGSAAFKYNVWHSLEHRALASMGLEVVPPLGRRERWELEPFLLAGAERAGFVVQAQVLGVWEEAGGISGSSYRVGVGREAGRFVPMVEAEWVVPRAGDDLLSLFPQLWIRLSRLGHVAASLGVELPAVAPAPRRPKLIGFLLWDYGDGPLSRGW